MASSYAKEFKHDALKHLPKSEAFNVEKEHRIINPHGMDFKTTNRCDF
jgi:hypothetical protein